MEIMLDTNILIEILKNNDKTIEIVNQYDYLYISEITRMELYFGAFNKQELYKIEKFLNLFEIISINEKISHKASKLIFNYSKSHNLDIPDSIIAATAIENNLKLFTYNLKDFKFIEELKIL